MPTRLTRLALIAVSGIVLAAASVAAQEPSPSVAPSANESFPQGYVVDEVEPGVFRIVSDGYRDLSAERRPDDVFAWGEWARTHESRHIVAAPDGSVRVLEDGRMFELGAKTVDRLRRQPPVRPGDDFEIAPDGTVWRIGIPRNSQSTLRAFDGKRWTGYLPQEQFCGVEVQPDGHVWATWSRPFGTGNGGMPGQVLGAVGRQALEGVRGPRGEAVLREPVRGDRQ